MAPASGTRTKVTKANEKDAAAIAIQSVRRGNLARKEFDLKKQAAEAAQREAISAQKAEELKAAAKEQKKLKQKQRR